MHKAGLIGIIKTYLLGNECKPRYFYTGHEIAKLDQVDYEKVELSALDKLTLKMDQLAFLKFTDANNYKAYAKQEKQNIRSGLYNLIRDYFKNDKISYSVNSAVIDFIVSRIAGFTSTKEGKAEISTTNYTKVIDAIIKSIIFVGHGAKITGSEYKEDQPEK
jgi:hypothetical protein